MDDQQLRELQIDLWIDFCQQLEDRMKALEVEIELLKRQRGLDAP